jgi:hypothetical protein
MTATEIASAAMNVVEVFADGEIADSVGTSLTCTEVETLADLFRATGHEQAAQVWIDCHAEGDDCGDSHCRCKDCTNTPEGAKP